MLTLAQQALSQTTLISSDVIGSIEAMIAELDTRIAELRRAGQARKVAIHGAGRPAQRGRRHTA